MRGSTAGLADTLASGSRAHAALLETADAFFASVVVAPAVVTYWQSTWTLMDLYVLPDNPVMSAAACAAFGLFYDIFVCVFQSQLHKFLNPDSGRLTYYVFSRLYTYLAAVACVGAWRGVWNLLNECTGDSARTLLSTTAAATLSLAALRALRNICAAPFAVAVDSPQDYFDVPTMFRTTMFRTSSRETMLYVLDCIFSVAVVGSLVVFVWRGSWALLDIFLYPDDKVTSCWTSLIVGYALVVVTFALQAPVRWAAARLHGAPRLLLADVYHLASFIATVNVWRGVWGLLDVYFFPETPKLSNWCSHVISLTLLVLLNCSNSILVRVYIDAEEPAGECVVFPCHYLRLYFHKERTKKRHRRALAAAAAAAAAKKPEDASLPLQLPEEKV
ncbi:LOW QUALITY PROTEIN: transmembrane protein fuseless [Aphomia sociella]